MPALVKVEENICTPEGLVVASPNVPGLENAPVTVKASVVGSNLPAVTVNVPSVVKLFVSRLTVPAEFISALPKFTDAFKVLALPVRVRVLLVVVPPKALIATLPDEDMVLAAGLEYVPTLVKSPQVIAPELAIIPLVWLSMALPPAAISPEPETVIVPLVLVITP